MRSNCELSDREVVGQMWHFRRKAKGEKIRDPIQGEFFATEAIENPAQALIRESVQNSLDAALDGSRVRIRFFLATGEHSASAESVHRYFEGAWPHLAAEKNGLQAPPSPAHSCPFLVVEDFGTSGLTGDPEQSDPIPGRDNPFLLFFRAEGLSAKSDKDRGRWGVGKFVFPRSSLASTHFGLTVRHDDRRSLLLGAATLKSHVLESVTYCPDGLYGIPGEEDFVSPIEDRHAIQTFTETFRLERVSEPGLSVVVPYLDQDISFDDLLAGAVKDYFLPILANDLELSVETPEQQVRLNASNLGTKLEELKDSVGQHIPALVSLASWAASVSDDQRIKLEMPNPDRSPKWTDAVVTAATASCIRQRLADGGPIAIRVPVTVHHREEGSQATHFDLYLTKDKQSDGHPCFAREGIIISDVRGRRARETRSIVIIDDKPLARMLGDSENPAHTQWQKDSSHFKGNYKFGPGILRFVTDSLGEIMRLVSQTELQADPSLTIDFFSVPPPPDLEGEEAEDQKESGGAGDQTEHPDVVITPRPSPITVTRHDGGFSVKPGTSPPEPPFLIEIKCAYDVRSGNPVKKYRPADFDLGREPFDLETDSHGIQIRRADGNHVIAQVDQQDFCLSVSGFDPARDVYVKAEHRVRSDADQAA